MRANMISMLQRLPCCEPLACKIIGLNIVFIVWVIIDQFVEQTVHETAALRGAVGRGDVHVFVDYDLDRGLREGLGLSHSAYDEGQVGGADAVPVPLRGELRYLFAELREIEISCAQQGYNKELVTALRLVARQLAGV